MTAISRFLSAVIGRLPACRCGRAVEAVCIAVAAVLYAAPAWAQQEGGTTIVVSQRTPYVESVVVLALCGAALFAVCRSSRRN